MTLRKTFLSLFALCYCIFFGAEPARAQSVGINTSGAAPDPSAMLDVAATDKGVLIPRVTLDDVTTQAPITAAPVEGLLIYNATGSAPTGFYYWDGAQWVPINSGGTAINSSLTFSGNTLSLTDPGGTLTANLGALSDSTDNDSVIGNETISSVNLTGSNILEVNEAGNTYTADLNALDSYWDRDAGEGELYPSNVGDSVGIGLQDPTAELHIKGKDVDITNNTAALKIWEQKDGDTLYMDGDEITGGLGGGVGNENALYLQHEASEHVVMATGTGMVGIGSGANYPGYELHVQESSSNELVRFRNMSTGNLSAMGVHGMAIESNGNGVGGEFQGGRQGVHGYVTTNSVAFPDQELAGVKGRSVNGNIDAINVGVKGRAYNSQDRNFAVHGYTLGQDAGDIGVDPTDYAIFGDLNRNGRNTTWAGYFNGDVHVAGTFTNPSDRSLKTDMKAQKNALGRLKKLDVYSYKFEGQPYLNLPQGKQFGFVAQDVEKVFPNLVKRTTFATSRPNADKKIPKKQYKSLNYLGFIPLLTRAIQEQEEKIEEKDQRIEELQKQVEKNDRELKELRADIKSLQKAVKEMKGE